MKRIIALLLITSMILGLSACGQKDDTTSGQDMTESQSQEKGNVTVEDGKVLYSNGGPEEFFEAPWLNPGTFFYNKVMYDHLLLADASLSPLAGEGKMAESYELSGDGKLLAFTLRDNLFWHDGDPVKASDVKWSIEYSLRTPSINSVFTSTFKAIEGVDEYLDGTADEISGIQVDGNMITIAFSGVAPDALLTFTQFAILPQKYFADVDPLNFQQAAFFQNPVGSGPFTIKEVKMNNYTLLEGFDKYWDGTADYTIHLNPSKGESDENLVSNVKAGLIDYAYTKNIADIQALQGVEGINIEKVDIRYTRLFYMNKFPKDDGSQSPLSDGRVRQAIAYALDMDSILEGVFQGAATTANSLTPNGKDKVEGLNDYTYNPEKAKELLAEAGWNPDTELDVVYYYTDQLTVDLMTIIQAYLSQVGIKMNFRLVEGDLATLLWATPEDTENGPSAVKWDMAYAGIGALSLHEYYDRFRDGASINSHTPSDNTLSGLIDATNASMDTATQQKAFYDLQKYENESLFCKALYYQPIFVITSDKIKEGASEIGNPQFNYNWDIQNWVVE